MTRMGFNRIFSFLLIFSMTWSLNGPAIAAQQNISAGVTAALIISGDYVLLGAPTPQGAPATLNVPTNFNLGSSDGTSTGFSVRSVSTPNVGLVNFLGNSTVTGTMGASSGSGQVLANITGGAAGTAVTFNGTVDSVEINFTAASTMTFNATTTAALHFNTFNGTAILGTGVGFNGAATNTAANMGVVTLNSGSLYTGAIGTATNFINQINLNGNANIAGAIASQNIVLGSNTLGQTGAVTFPTGASITVRALSDTAFGNIAAPGQAINFTTGLLVHMLVDDTVILSGVPLQVVTGTSGTFGPGSAPITVTSNNVRFTFTGLNPAGTGNVLIFPTVVPPVLPPGAGGAAAAAFDAAFFGATGDLLLVQQLITALNDLEAIGAALAQLGPTVNGGNAFMSIEALNQFQNLWQSNLAKARSANMCYPTLCDSDPSCLSLCHSSCDPCNPRPVRGEHAWNGEGLWIDGFGYSANQRTRMQIAGYDGKMYGGMVGVQRPISKHWQLGIGGGYAYSEIHGKGIQRNGTRINTPQATLYLGYTSGPWFLDNFFTYAWNHYNSFRHIQFPGLDRTARASYNGQEYGLLFSGGYNYFHETGVTLTPLASLQFTKLRISGYTEKDALSLNLVQKSQHYDVVQSSLGLMVGYPVELNYGTLYTEVHSKWLYDIKDYQIKNQSIFLGGGPSFNTVGVSPPRNQLNVGISSTLFTAGNLALKASYEFNYRREFTAHQGRATVAYKF